MLFMEVFCVLRMDRRVVLGEVMSWFQFDYFNMVFKYVVLELKLDLVFVKMLFDFGVELIYDNGVCIKNVVCNFECDLLYLLVGYVGKVLEFFIQVFVVIFS